MPQLRDDAGANDDCGSTTEQEATLCDREIARTKELDVARRKDRKGASKDGNDEESGCTERGHRHCCADLRSAAEGGRRGG